MLLRRHHSIEQHSVKQAEVETKAASKIAAAKQETKATKLTKTKRDD